MDEKKYTELENRIRTLEQSRGIDRNLGSLAKKEVEDTISDSILDIVWDKYFYYQTYFESLDGWNLTDTSAGSSLTSRLGVHLVTGSTSGDISSIDKEPVYQDVLSYDQPSRFSSAFFVTSVTEMESFIGIGFVNNGATGKHYGFFINDATLYGTCADGTTQTTVAIKTISTDHPTSIEPIYFVEARFYPGYKIDFSVREDSGTITSRTITTNIPSGFMNEWLSAQTKTTTTAVADFRFGHMEYIQRRQPK